mgnify:CR=1 FL=1
MRRFARLTVSDDNATAETPAPQTLGASVDSTQNHVYFYRDINADTCLSLMKALREVDTGLYYDRMAYNLPDDYPHIPIYLHIQSDGGDAFASLQLADYIKTLKSPVYSIVEGCACSGATIVSAACEKRYITPNAFLMIHQVSSFAWGTYEQFKDEVKLLDMIMQKLTAFYQQHSDMTPETIAEALKHDTWMDAQMAIDAGLVDEVWQ